MSGYKKVLFPEFLKKLYAKYFQGIAFLAAVEILGIALSVATLTNTDGTVVDTTGAVVGVCMVVLSPIALGAWIYFKWRAYTQSIEDSDVQSRETYLVESLIKLAEAIWSGNEKDLIEATKKVQTAGRNLMRVTFSLKSLNDLVDTARARSEVLETTKAIFVTIKVTNKKNQQSEMRLSLCFTHKGKKSTDLVASTFVWYETI